jgi:glycosyltransferase involved in cell wall biosynthesis
MPVRNALPYLDAAVESILGQTFSNFEFVILDDASNDGSVERLRDWARRDQRIRLIDVDVQGAETLRRLVPDALLIFIAPPSLEELERR